MNIDFQDFDVIEEEVSIYDMPKVPGVTISFEYDFKTAVHFVEGNNDRITFSPKIGDEGVYKFMIKLIYSAPITTT